MFKNTFQSGFLSILYSIGSKPLQIWDKKVEKIFFEIKNMKFYKKYEFLKLKKNFKQTKG